MSALAQALVAIIAVYGFVVGLLVFGSRGMADAVIEQPIDAAESMEPAAPAALNVVSLRPDHQMAWNPAPAPAQAS
jgi:hypothetical protein